MARVSVFRQLLVLQWKNFLLRRRHFVVTTCEILLPILAVGAIALLRTQAPAIEGGASDPKIYPPTEPKDYFHFTSLELLCPGCILGFTPNTSETREIMRRFNTSSNEVRAFESEDDMVTYLSRSDFLDNVDPPIKAGIVFTNVDMATGQFKYTLRPVSYTIRTDSLFPTSDVSIFTELIHGGAYINGGVAGLQIALDKELIRLSAGKYDEKFDFDLNLRAFPHLPPPGTWNFGGILFPALLVFAFAFIVVSVARNVAAERENGAKELMTTSAGVPNWIHWLSWGLNSMLIHAVVVTMIVLLLSCSFKAGAGPVVANGDWTLWWVVIFLYTIAATSFAFFVSVFSRKPSLSAAIGISLWLISFYPLYVPLTTNLNALSSASKWLTCLSPQMALYWAIGMMLNADGRGRWDKINAPLNLSDSWCVLNMVTMLLVDAVLYFVLTVFVEQVQYRGNATLKRRSAKGSSGAVAMRRLENKAQSDLAAGNCPVIDSLTVREHVRLFAMLRDATWRQAKEVAAQNLGLQDKSKAKAKELSMDQKLKLRIAMKLAGCKSEGAGDLEGLATAFSEVVPNAEAENDGQRAMRPEPSELQRFLLLVSARWQSAKRNPALLIAQLVLLPLMLIGATLLTNFLLYTPASTSSPLEINPALYSNPHILFSYGTGPEAFSLGATYESLAHTSESAAVDRVPDLLNELQAVAARDPRGYREGYIVGANFESSTNVTAMYSLAPRHAVPLSINLVTNTILKSRAYLRAPDQRAPRIEVVIHPLDNELAPILEAAQPNPAHTVVAPVFYAGWIAIALALLGATFGKACKGAMATKSTKQRWYSWGASFAWDMWIIILVIHIAFVCLAACGQPEGIGPIFAILFLWGFAAIPFSYFGILIAPSSWSRARMAAVLLLVHLATGLLASIVPPTSPGGLQAAAGVISPGFGGARAIMRFASISATNRRCSLISTGAKALFCRPGLEIDPLILQCCDNCKHINTNTYGAASCFQAAPFWIWTQHQKEELSETDTEEWEFGRHLLIMCGSGVLYIILFVLLESGVLKRPRNRIRVTA